MKIMKRWIPAAMLAVLGSAAASAADQLYVFEGPRTGAPYTLATLNTGDGTRTLIREYSADALGGRPHAMTFSETYGVILLMNRDNNAIAVIDPSNGAVVTVLPDVFTMDGPFTGLVDDGGVLYGLSRNSTLFSVNIDGSDETVLGGGSANGSLTMSSAGTLHGSNRGSSIYTVSKANGATALVTNATGMSYNRIRGMAFGAADTLYVGDYQNCCDANIHSVNLGTGVSTLLTSAVNHEFLLAYGSDAGPLDTDADGLPDLYEDTNGTDKNDASDAETDADGDGLTLLEEYTLGTDPAAADSDNDGLADGEEVDLGTDPLEADTDDDFISDGVEVVAGLDPTVNGLGLFEFDAGTDAQYATVRVDADGNYHFAWAAEDANSDDVIFYAMYSDAGEALISPTQVSDSALNFGGNRNRPQIKIDAEGRAWINYHDDSGSDSYLVIVDPAADDQAGDELDAAAVVLAEINIDEIPAFMTGEELAHGQLAFDSNGVAHMVFDDTNDNVYYARVDDTGATDLAQLVTVDEDGFHTYPNVVVDADNNAHVFWGRYNNGYTLMYAMIDGDDANGAFLIAPTVLSTNLDAGGDDAHFRFPYAAIDAEGVIHLVYGRRITENSGSGGQIEYRSLNPAGADQDGSRSTPGDLSLSEPVVLSDLGPSGMPWYPVMEMRDGTLFVTWFGLGGGDDPALGWGYAAVYTPATGEFASIRFTKEASEPNGYNFPFGNSGDRVVWIENDSTIRTIKPFQAVSAATQGADIGMKSAGGTLFHFEEVAEADLEEAESAALDEDYTYPAGFVRFVIGNLTAGASTTVTFTFAEDVPADATMFKFINGAWIEANVARGENPNELIVVYRDGGPYDADGEVNGVIVDPIGMAVPVPVEEPTPEPTPTPVNVSGGGGGGCVIGDGERPIDPLFPSLLALAAVYIIRRRVTN